MLNWALQSHYQLDHCKPGLPLVLGIKDKF